MILDSQSTLRADVKPQPNQNQIVLWGAGRTIIRTGHILKQIGGALEKLFTLGEVCNIFLDAWDTGYNAACHPNKDDFTADQAWNNYVKSSRITKLNEVVKESPTIPDPNSVKPQDLLCPECGHSMIARSNRQSGEKFWGCSKFPQCRGTRDSQGLSKYERESAKVTKETEYPHQEGYKFRKG